MDLALLRDPEGRFATLPNPFTLKNDVAWEAT
jgi:hypothetical protein